MDKHRVPTHKGWFLARPVALGVGLLVTAALFWHYSSDLPPYSTEGKTLLTSEVQQGDFLVTVRGAGILAPRQVQWLATRYAGHVRSVTVKAGAVVKQGQILAQLDNPELEQAELQASWELESFQAELTAQQVALTSAILDQQKVLLDTELNLVSTQNRLVAEKQLIEQGFGALSKLDYDRTRLDAQKYQQLLGIEQQRLDQLKKNQQAQLSALQAQLKNKKRNLQQIQQQLASLTFTAPQDAVVQAVELEAGQQLQAGVSVIKLAQHHDLIAELQISELQIRDISQGQLVWIDTRNAKIQGKVERIDPKVVNGTVQVDVSLSGELPAEARPDLTVEGTIHVSEVNSTLFVARPTQVQPSREQWVYRLNAEGDRAQQVKVRFGQNASQHIQILEGLQAGDRIIVSDTAAFSSHQTIAIQ